MSYTHILVAVAVTPESHQLLAKAVSIARPVQAKVSLITLASDPELYNQFAAPMMEDLRAVMHEETENFLKMLGEKADYPIEQTFIASGELSQHILLCAANTMLIWSFAATITTVSFRARPARQKVSSAPAR